MELGLQGRTVLVTGAPGGIGRALARAFAREGAHVVLGWNSREREADELARSIVAEGGAASTRRVALDGPAPDAAADVDVIVANAAAWPEEAGEADTLRRSLEVNVVGHVALVEQALPGMRARGWGRIVAVSTDIVAQPYAAGLAYPVAKAALESASRVWAVREARSGILSNVVRPGFTLTDFARTSQWREPEELATPTGRLGTPDEVAALVVWLASSANGHVNGQTVSTGAGRELTR